ncbi:Hypothetical protein, putative [Bodo saltans]|uniref:Uncharacterized protein n=1 Tax=Bodo saltans TaxID=75058 RepID=A0A0S4JGW8_BODSA|nr:Hypothetical protein, putative [Bodo saltans]|eukprot:CUG89271.1 Hypothetical protein, putative [Bodo saltans]
MSMPDDGWVDFEAMMCSLLYLHAFGGVCAGSLDIALSDVDCKSADLPADEADPIAQVKTWIRLNAKCAKRVVQATLKTKVLSCEGASTELKSLAEEQAGTSVEERLPCIVIARNGDYASFSDVMVGLVEVTNGGYTTTHLLLLRLKYLDNTSFSVYDEWRELYKDGQHRCEGGWLLIVWRCLNIIHGTKQWLASIPQELLRQHTLG